MRVKHDPYIAVAPYQQADYYYHQQYNQQHGANGTGLYGKNLQHAAADYNHYPYGSKPMLHQPVIKQTSYSTGSLPYMSKKLELLDLNGTSTPSRPQPSTQQPQIVQGAGCNSKGQTNNHQAPVGLAKSYSTSTNNTAFSRHLTGTNGATNIMVNEPVRKPDVGPISPNRSSMPPVIPLYHLPLFWELASSLRSTHLPPSPRRRKSAKPRPTSPHPQSQTGR